ncbi:serine/threonine protein kinase [Pseudenhygromyxa sp. WMMC2535]|uniref:serine/threonine-protein kinase n=1 Tax=Pseudenhygromyxa sp. WMMC2535 TaxID=2712867 RepID=UPI0015517D8F|nr:serine/threonine-protein kinase [Pseudenhygromyxa sp. WMMC2535]NVB41686.1 serine/threonine protein kinase [Pseudenhygromyxa sp. WMMC2535]
MDGSRLVTERERPEAQVESAAEPAAAGSSSGSSRWEPATASGTPGGGSSWEPAAEPAPGVPVREADEDTCPGIQAPMLAGSGQVDPMSKPKLRPGSGAQVQAFGRAETADQEEALVGQVLSERYRVDERIGVGGMGVVYRATHVMIGKAVAVKVLRPRHAKQREIATRFAQEARVASSIKHPNIVDISDYGTTATGSPFYVMELLPGHSLASEIRQLGALEPERAVRLVCTIARGLAAAHAAGIVHRDLKPDNVFLVPATAEAPEQVKVLDFGIARDIGRDIRLTVTGSVVGTPEYMSPEQARGEEVDLRADLYSLGIILYEALTGRLPLEGDTQVGTMTKQVYDLPPPLREIDPSFAAAPHIEAVLARLLAKPRSERPGSALEVVRLLEEAAKADLDSFSEIAAGQRRRATIMLGSGAVAGAHKTAEDDDGPATGSFSAKRASDEELETGRPRRPSIIIRAGDEGVTRGNRPARILGTPPHVDVGPRATPTPTPIPTKRRKRSRRARQRQLQLVLLVAGTAMVAAMLTLIAVHFVG